MKAKIDDFNLIIDLDELIEGMSTEDQKRLAKRLAMEEALLDSVVNQLVDGATEDGWYCSAQFIEKMRLKVMEKLPEIETAAVKQILADREIMRADSRRMSEWAWSLFHAWPSDAGRSRPSIPDNEVLWPTDEDARKAIEEAKAKEGGHDP